MEDSGTASFTAKRLQTGCRGAHSAFLFNPPKKAGHRAAWRSHQRYRGALEGGSVLRKGSESGKQRGRL